jgi:hypothetical protein
MTAYPQKITFGQLRASGVSYVLVYCRDHKCSHHITLSADRWRDDVRLSDIEPGFVCTACGKRGADRAWAPVDAVVRAIGSERASTAQVFRCLSGF